MAFDQDQDLDLSAEIEVLRAMQRLEQAKGDRESMRTELKALHTLLVGRAEAPQNLVPFRAPPRAAESKTKECRLGRPAGD